MENQLNQIQIDAEKEIKESNNLDQLLEVEKKFLGKKGSLKSILSQLKDLSIEEKKAIGKLSNQIKEVLLDLIQSQKNKIQEEEIQNQLNNEFLDVTLPSIKATKGSTHLLKQVQQKLEEIFINLGFQVVDGPEVESEKYNFEDLNIPQSHPARDMYDTFFIDQKTEQYNRLLLRTHTSPVQIRHMLKNGAPVKVLVPGRVFRYEESDATHEHTFMQYEGLFIDKDINLSHLKGYIEEIFGQFFGSKVDVRFRPGYFPFTEPSLEFEISCPFCKSGCKVCKQTKYIELGGCGMVHPNVLKAAGIDSEKYQGFAFGGGLDRLAMLITQTNDLRLFRQNDIRFLKQF